MTVTAAVRGAQAARPPAPRLAVRNATTADASAVLEVWNDGRIGAPAWIDEAVEWIARHQRAHRPLWVAESGGVTAGLLSFLGCSDQPGGDAACMLSVHVRQAQRGRGLGRALVERAIAAAPMLGYDRYAACVRSDDAAALALFRGLGFHTWGCLPGVLQSAGQRFDVLVFGIEL